VNNLFKVELNKVNNLFKVELNKVNNLFQVEQITKEQNYQRYREERFRQTSESTNQRVLWLVFSSNGGADGSGYSFFSKVT